MEIRPIRNEADYEAALAEIERLFDAAPNTSESDRLDVLTTLVEAYEMHHYPIPEPDPVEAIKYYMESRGLSRADLEPYIGGRARVAEVLNRKRALYDLRPEVSQKLQYPLTVLPLLHAEYTLLLSLHRSVCHPETPI